MPAKIEDVFIDIATDFSGVIKKINGGTFAATEFKVNQSIYNSCSFLEGTLDALPLNESFLLEGMVIVSNSIEYNIDLEFFKSDIYIEILIHNRTNVYKQVDYLNQTRNEIFFIKREIEKKNIELEKLRKIADRANEEKSRFLATMSHEIRNPLNSILGYAEMISSEELNDKVLTYIQNLSSAGKILKVIVDDILDLSRIEAGKLKIVLEEMSIYEVLNNCKNDFEHLINNKNVKLRFLKPEKLPDFVLGDSIRIQQVLANLISNALKFTEKGSVKILTEIDSETENDIKIRFSVTDTGRGMSKEQCLTVFDEYQQNELDDHRVYGGAGLGLAIVNRLVKAMDGEVSVKSKLHIGSTFFVEIPFSKVFNKKEKKIRSSGSVNLKNKKILVADDDLLSQTLVSHILKKEHVNLTIVKDGLEALSKVKEEKFDVVLLDINMPNMTGEQLMKQIYVSESINSKTPFLALTGNTTTEDVKRYLSLGFVNVISKPYTINNLVGKIKEVL